MERTLQVLQEEKALLSMQTNRMF